MTKGKPQERGGKFARVEFGPEHRATARALFEGRPGTTIEEVALEIGAAPSTVRRWKFESAKAGRPWRAARHKAPALAGRAGEIANQHAMRIAELGPAADGEQAHQAAEIATADQVAAELRATVIDRHRKEWSAPRKLAYDAIQKAATDPVTAYERAKLAKITAETLQIVQASERKAWGLDQQALGPDAEGVVVVVERTSKQLPCAD
ncbi:hypothetical protein JQ608_38450 [Bradyrhizobium liaoningense]|uniref:hypothetical protein n=1 Tax=Bradyrhizobium liaoningense TaxID=43992 RepID=UPI001BAB4D47|nr:hypothetical protein [Bradyrhizobium liaoningense]MBR0882906.1 hypothetical protein [Bradyrhizobium liaoningense]